MNSLSLDKNGEAGRVSQTTSLLYYLGAVLMVLGGLLTFWLNWDLVDDRVKVLSTLGLGVAAFWLACLLVNRPRMIEASKAFFLASALVLPIGFYAVSEIYGYNFWGGGSLTVMSALLFATYFTSYIVFKKNIFVFLSIIFGTLLFFGFTNLIVEGTVFEANVNYFLYRLVALGISCILLARSFEDSELAGFCGFMYWAGGLINLGGIFLLGSFGASANLIWELILVVVVVIYLTLGNLLQVRALDVLGIIFMVAAILRTSLAHFPDAKLWPLGLVIAGLVSIVAGYFLLSRKAKN